MDLYILDGSANKGASPTSGFSLGKGVNVLKGNLVWAGLLLHVAKYILISAGRMEESWGFCRAVNCRRHQYSETVHSFTHSLHSFIHSLDKDFLRAHHVFDTIAGAGTLTVNKTDKGPDFLELYSMRDKIINTINEWIWKSVSVESYGRK